MVCRLTQQPAPGAVLSFALRRARKPPRFGNVTDRPFNLSCQWSYFLERARAIARLVSSKKQGEVAANTVGDKRAR